MKFGELITNCLDFIDKHRKIIITTLLSILGVIVLSIMLFLSSDELSVSKESNDLLKFIEKRQYSQAIEYYEKCKQNYSNNKINRLNNDVSKKLNKLLLDSGDKFINDQITKEHFLGLINTINALENIEIDLKKIISQVKRIDEMYKSENIKYDKTISYINTVSVLNGISDSIDLYKNNIKETYESRQIYNTGIKYKQSNKYYEAIKSFDKVLESDTKYYDLAQKYKKECIEMMYDYYLQKAEEANKQGYYEEALQYIGYIKSYYYEDEKIAQLEKEYQENLSLYTLTTDDILNLIVRKSDKQKANLAVNSFQQMLNGKKYYYVEVYEYGKLIDEVLVDAKDKLLYSYKDAAKHYNTDYSDGYFRVKSDGSVQFTISEDEAKFILENKLKEKQEKYKAISSIQKEKIYKYVNNKVDVDKILGNDADLYYYQLVNKGLFREKKVFITNMYTKEVYIITDDSIVEF